MDELSALAGSEGYEVCADDAQGVQPLVRSSATQRMTVRTGIQAPHTRPQASVSEANRRRRLLGRRRTHYGAAHATPYRSAPLSPPRDFRALCPLASRHLRFLRMKKQPPQKR